MSNVSHGAHKSENHQLILNPSESRIGYNDNRFYTFRLPLHIMEVEDPNTLCSIVDTAKAVFRHNKPDSKKVIITCPEGGTKKLIWITRALEKEGMKVTMQVQPKNKFIDLSVIGGVELCCVDRRMDDKGATEDSTQITHSGGPLVLHPDLEKVESIQPYRQTIIRSLSAANAAGSPVKRLDYHFGAEGGAGCGMYATLLKDPVIGPIFRAKLNTPDQIRVMLDKIRHGLRDILSADCRITGTVIDGKEASIVYDLDKRADAKGLSEERDLVL
jgi:hypothetical protein